MQCSSPQGYICYCNYKQDFRVNIYTCSSKNAKGFPSTIHDNTNWLVVENTNITNLHETMDYFKEIWSLSLHKNKISSIWESFWQQMIEYRNIKRLNLSRNKIVSISQKVKEMFWLENIWLAGNPFHCNCEMTWMIGWINNFTTSSGEHTVVDYQDVKCHSGMMIGTPIYKLKEVEMGCFPNRMTLRQKVGIGMGSGIAILLIITLVTWILKRSREFKFFMYYYLKLDTVPKDDKDEYVENMEYDAFFCYRYVNFNVEFGFC